MTYLSSEQERNEALPRVSSLYHFLNEEMFNAIPRAILDAKAAAGTHNHHIIETRYTGEVDTENMLVNTFTKGYRAIFTEQERENMNFEGQLNGKRFTGKPDLHVPLAGAVVDNKFTVELNPTNALQLVLYGILLDEVRGGEVTNHYVFHCPTVGDALFIHKVRSEVIETLKKFAEFLIEKHSEIEAGELIRYHAFSMWDKICDDNVMFELVDTVDFPLAITDLDTACAAAAKFAHLSKVEARIKELKRDLTKYMVGSGETYLGDADGYGVSLVNRKTKVYDGVKKAAAKKVFDAGMEAAVIDTITTQSLRRQKPSKKIKGA